MKTSLYNIILPYKTTFIVYNCLWDTCLMIDKDDKALTILKAISIIDDDNIPRQFIDNKMVIEDNLDELSIMKKRWDHANKNEGNYLLTINPTLDCNFCCWYCYENHANKRKMDDDDVRKIVRYIQKIYAKDSTKAINLGFFGGEPLLCFKIIKKITNEVEKISWLYGKSYTTSMTSNAYFLNEKVIDFFKAHHIQSIQITLDGNKERHDKVRFNAGGKGSYDTIVGNIKCALNKGINILVRFNISENTNLDINRVLKEFCNLNERAKSHLTFAIQKVWQAPEAVYDTISGIANKIKNIGYKCQTINVLFNPLWPCTCYADKSQHVVINPGGKIYGCTARDFTEENVEGQLLEDGSIVFNNLRSKRLSQSPFNNSECRRCPILPICIGGCKQRMFEQKEKDKCFFGYTEEDKMKYAKRYIMERFS